MQRIRQLRDSDENERLDTELFAIFRTDGVEEFGHLETACRDRDAERLARHAHKLRGMSGNLGMHALQEQLVVVEAEARNTRLHLDFDSIQADLKLLFQRTMEAFEAYIVESS
jgi:HPt (histidine-containing phosphotransfer) domain-containing protein